MCLQKINMRRILRIFLLYSQHALEYKWRSLVWFLVTLSESAMYLLFWRGAILDNNSVWNLPGAVSYYLLMIIAGCLLHVHIEEEVAFEDIQLGWLSRYLTKPFSYYWIKFCQELPWRIIQGTFGVIILCTAIAFYKFPLAKPAQYPYIALIILFGYLLSFTYKMIVGLSAFWVTDFRGVNNLETMISLIFAGYILPLSLLPGGLREVALAGPIAHMIYYPVIAFQGNMSVLGLWKVIGAQILWILFFLWLYRLVWRSGLRRFTAVGQ